MFRIFICFLLFGTQVLFSQKGRVDTVNLNKLIRFCDSTKADEIWINYNNNLIKKWKNNSCDSLVFGTASMVKSWIGILTGILIDKGVIESENELVCKYLPEWYDGCKKKVTLTDLLTMTSGMQKKGPYGVLSQGDNNAYVLNLKLNTLPKIKFSYSNESVQLIGIIIERSTKMGLAQAFEKYLFKPLQITETSFMKDSVGNFVAYGGCKTNMEAAMKIGMLMLNKGKHNGVQIVSENWVEKSTTSSPYASFYGYLWWIDKNSKYWNYAATGDLGQLTIVFPELGIVFVRRQSCDLSKPSKNMSWMSPKFIELIIDIIQ